VSNNKLGDKETESSDEASWCYSPSDSIRWSPPGTPEPGTSNKEQERSSEVRTVVESEVVKDSAGNPESGEGTAVRTKRKKESSGARRKRQLLQLRSANQDKRIVEETEAGVRCTLVQEGNNQTATREPCTSWPTSLQHYLPKLPENSPAWEVREALNGRLGPEALHFVALIVRDRIGSSLRKDKRK
jgi:hypothetical protein